MSNQKKLFSKQVSAIVVLVLFIATILITFITESHSNISVSNQFMKLLVDQHIYIMASLVLVSIGFGFFWAQILYKQVQTSEKTSKSMMQTIYEFLSLEEQKVLDHLIRESGESRQSEVSKLEGMNKVKAHRAIQKMVDKNLLSVTAHGKVRYIVLKKSIYDILSDE